MALAISNFLTGAVLVLMYTLHQHGWGWGWLEDPRAPSALPAWVAVSGCFGAIVPTSMGLVAARLAWGLVRRWWLLVAIGPVLCSLISFVAVWSPESVPIFIAVAALGGSALNFLALRVAGVAAAETACAVRQRESRPARGRSGGRRVASVRSKG